MSWTWCAAPISSPFTTPSSVDPAKIIKKWNGTALTARNNLLGGRPADLLALHNAGVPGETLGDDAGWTPTLRPRVDAPRVVPGAVDGGAGAGRRL